jgi:hypothetical protein
MFVEKILNAVTCQRRENNKIHVSALSDTQKVMQSHYRPGVAQRIPGFQEVKVPQFHDNNTG